MIRPFLVAVQFLTRLPVRLTAPMSEKDVGYSLLYYPLVGLIIGLILVGFGWLLSGMPPQVSSALLVTAWILLTGGLHLDGLADSADAWIGGLGNREETLAIMKDPNCGPAGVSAIILVILLKFVSLHSLNIAGEWIAIVLATILARTLLLLLFLTAPYVRNNGLGSTLAAFQPRQGSIFVITLTVALIFLLTGNRYLWLLLTAVAVFLLLRNLMLHRIGGITGDTAGALVEISEVAILLVAVTVIIE